MSYLRKCSEKRRNRHGCHLVTSIAENLAYSLLFKRLSPEDNFIKYSFLMDNVNFSGEWTGHFRQAENGTEVIFTESISLKKWWLYPFALLYLKLQQKRYIADLKRKCEQE